MQVHSFFRLLGGRSALALLVCSFALVVATELRAQEVPASSTSDVRVNNSATIAVLFEYSAPSDCPNGDRVFSLVHRRSERLIRVHDASASQRLVMDISSYPQGYRGELTVLRTGQNKERRSMKGTTCSEVVEALALTAALSIDPNATLTLGPLDDGDPTEVSSNTERSPLDNDSNGNPNTEPQEQLKPDQGDKSVRRQRSRAQRDNQAYRLGLGLALTLQKTMDRSVHVGGGLAFSWSEPEATWFPLEFRVFAQMLLDTAKDDVPAIRTRLWLSNVAYCPLRLGEKHALLVCPLLQLGAIVAKSEGLQADSTATRFFAATGAQLELRTQLAQNMDLWLIPAFLLPLTEREFAVEPGPEVLRSTVFPGWSASLGANWAF